MNIVSLKDPAAVKIVEFVRQNLKYCPSAEKFVVVLKKQQNYFCIYITKALYYKVRLYCAEPTLKLQPDQHELGRSMVQAGNFLETETDQALSLYKVRYRN